MDSYIKQEKEIPHRVGRSGHSLNGTGLDCLSLSGEDIAEWIAARDGAPA